MPESHRATRSTVFDGINWPTQGHFSTVAKRFAVSTTEPRSYASRNIVLCRTVTVAKRSWCRSRYLNDNYWLHDSLSKQPGASRSRDVVHVHNRVRAVGWVDKPSVDEIVNVIAGFQPSLHPAGDLRYCLAEQLSPATNLDTHT